MQRICSYCGNTYLCRYAGKKYNNWNKHYCSRHCGGLAVGHNTTGKSIKSRNIHNKLVWYKQLKILIENDRKALKEMFI